MAAERAPGMVRHPQPHRTFWFVFPLALLLLAGWAVASPDMASPDEPAHAAKAAATVRGEFFADETGYNPGRGTFDLPNLFGQAWGLPCYAFDPNTPANCTAGVSGDLDSVVAVASHVERYNPVYYALIGIPSLFPLSEWTFTAMRLVSALINAALIALTFAVLASLRRPALPMVGALAAITPMTLFIGSSMTPQGPEIFGALLLLASLLSMVFEPDADLLPLRAWLMVTGTVALVLTRGLSPAYLGIIVLVALAAAPWATVVGIVTNRRFWVPLGICAGVWVAAVGYTLASGSLALGVVFPEPSLTAPEVIGRMVSSTDYYLEQILGTFGWGDVPLPLWVHLLTGGVAMLVGILALAVARWRHRLLLVAVVAVSLALPIAVQLVSFRESGLVWQGKYVLPVAIAAPVLAGFVAGASPATRDVAAPLLRVGVAVVALGQIAAITINLHRYINGSDGPWLAFIDSPWLPRIPLFLLIGSQLVAWLTIILVVRRVSHRWTAPSAEPASPTDGAGQPATVPS